MSCSLERPPASSATRSRVTGSSSCPRWSSCRAETSLPTTSVTTVLAGSCAPPAGVWLRTTPSEFGSVTSCVITCERKPDACSVCCAEPRSLEVTSGTVEVFGPFETVSDTTEPLPADSPDCGLWLITVFDGWVSST